MEGETKAMLGETKGDTGVENAQFLIRPRQLRVTSQASRAKSEVETRLRKLIALRKRFYIEMLSDV